MHVATGKLPARVWVFNGYRVVEGLLWTSSILLVNIMARI